MAKVPEIELKVVPWGFKWCKDRGLYRVWRTNWAGDMFEVMEWFEFNALEQFAKQFAISFEEHFDGEEN